MRLLSGSARSALYGIDILDHKYVHDDASLADCQLLAVSTAQPFPATVV
jgi:hypothetical protein